MSKSHLHYSTNAEILNDPRQLTVSEFELTKSMAGFIVDNKKYCVMRDNLLWHLYELKRWCSVGFCGSNFTQKLLDLIAKADTNNKKKILCGFPEAVCVYLLWFWKTGYNTDEEFFKDMENKLKPEAEETENETETEDNEEKI